LDQKAVSILPLRIQHFTEHASLILSKWPDITNRDLARVIGRIISLSPVFDGITQIKTKMCQTFLNIRHYRNLDWDAKIYADFGPLYADALDEIKFWLTHVATHNLKYFLQQPVTISCWTDASAHAIAGLAIPHVRPLTIKPITIDNILIGADMRHRVMVYYDTIQADKFPWSGIDKCVFRDNFDVNPAQVDKIAVAYRQLTRKETFLDSNERELLAAQYLILSLLPMLKGNSIMLYTDNLNAAGILEHGSNKPRLQYYAKSVSDLCIQNDICLTPVWIPRSLNVTADVLSKCYDPDNYGVTDIFFHRVCVDFGIFPNLDLFADNINRKTRRFFSVSFCPGTVGVDAFKQNWAPPNICWAFPPTKHISDAILKMVSDKAIGLLLVPQWKNQSFYPLLRSIPAKNVIDRFVYCGKDKFIAGNDPTSYFKHDFDANIEVWSLNFNTL
jgi:hypothetical protein